MRSGGGRTWALALALALGTACGPVERAAPRSAAPELHAPGQRGDELSVLSYNTHGLAAWIAGDDPERRFPRIGQLSNRYDLALLQEDFEHHARLRDGARQPVIRRGNGSRFAGCGFCSGSGLTLLSHLDPARLLGVDSRAYESCSGWVLGANDCLATKGFQVARVALPAGGEIHVVNTHLDAGAGGADREARSRQLDLLEDEVARSVGDGPLIVAGDLNLDAAHPEDRSLLDRFRARLSLRDSGARAEPGSGFLVLDYILYRPGPSLGLEVLEAGQDPSFYTDGEHLSDHPALFARFRLSPLDQ